MESASSSARKKVVCYRHTQSLSRNLIPYQHQCFIKRHRNLIFTPQINFFFLGGGGGSISSFISTVIRNPSLYVQNLSPLYFTSRSQPQRHLSRVPLIYHGCPTRGPPGYIMRPAETFINYMFTLNIAQ
jgi:hypothetical protein